MKLQLLNYKWYKYIYTMSPKLTTQPLDDQLNYHLLHPPSQLNVNLPRESFNRN